MASYFKSLFHNKNVVSVICGVVCIFIIFLAYRERVNDKVKAVDVPYALVSIDARTQINEKMIGTVKVASSMLTDNVIRKKDEIINKFVNYNTTIPQGSLFYRSSIVEWKDMPDSAWSDIENDNTIVSLSVSGFTMFSNSIYPNAVIDLYYQTYAEDGRETKLVYGKLIENIKVLAVKDEDGNHIFTRDANQKSASAIIFSVNEDLNILLRKANYLSGTVVPVLRNTNYTDSSLNTNATSVTSKYIRTLIEEQTVMLSEDVKNDVNNDVKIEE